MTLTIVVIAIVNVVCAILVYGLSLAEIQARFPTLRNSNDLKRSVLIGISYGGLLGPIGLLLFWLVFGDHGFQWTSLPPMVER